MSSEHVVRFEVPTLEVLDRIVAAPLPRAGEPEAEFFRDLYLDTEEGDLERRGVTVRVRIRVEAATLTVEVRDRAAPPPAPVLRRAEAEGVDPEDPLAADSEPVRLLRAVTDPARLAPRLELETARRVRPLHADAPGTLACDVVTVRAGEESRELYEVVLRLPAGCPEAEALRSTLAEEHGLHPVSGDRLARARALLAEGFATPAPREGEPRPGGEVAVLAAGGGEVALVREGSTLRVPVGEGSGEEACRAVLRDHLGREAGSLRLLGTAEAEGRPALQVWLAEDVPRNGQDAGDLDWLPLARVLAAAGTPALQDRRTLAALHVAARSELAGGEEGADEAGRTAATVAVASAEGAGGADEELPPGALLNMELSMLAFNRRVLVLAEDPRTPLLERVRFVSIFGANLDEFFRVRVAGFKRQVATGSTKRTIDGALPEEQLDAIRIRARQLSERAYALLRRALLPALAEHGVEILAPGALTGEERDHLRAWYGDRVHPLLTPLAVGPGHPFPHIRNLRPALAVVVRDPEEGAEHFTVVELPGDLPRLVPLPREHRRVPLEDVIRVHLPELYPGMEVVRAHVFRVTRSAELQLPRGRAVEDLLETVEAELEKRPFRPVVRLEVERTMPEATRRFLLRELQFEARDRVSVLGEEDLYPVDGLIDLRGLREVASLPFPELHYPPFEPRTPVDPGRPVFDVLREREVLVHYPFDSFEESVERFLVEASRDPDVFSIELALYRTDRSSRIVEALRQARQRGKRVVALVELTARFDEQRNTEWARYLQEAGIHVIYGVPGRKIHAKVALVVRREGDEFRRYTYIGTGNLNAATASAYTDLGLLTADPALGADVDDLFNVLSARSGKAEYRRLLVAPYNMRRRFVELIERETALAREGRGGHLRVKVNGLADREVIATLYRASRAGVKVELIVRGICSLRPGVPGLSENIRVYSILGRFLEHSRIFHFANGGDPEYFIGSADWRTRNLSRRVEAITPITDPEHRAELDRILEEQLAAPDAWELGSDGSYYRRPERAPHAANSEE